MPVSLGLVLTLLVASVRGAASSSAVDTRPNIVMVMVDDWGYDDVSFRRNDSDVQTPNIDGLVKEGIVLDQAYSFYWCTPSRSSFLSGRLPLNVFQTNAKIFVSIWDEKDPETAGTGIPRGMTTLPGYLKQAGYTTHAVGKWDAGIATPTHTPKGRGFDSSLIYFSHDNDCFKYNVSDIVVNEFPLECRRSQYKYGFTDSWTNEGPNQNVTGVYEELMFRDHIIKTIQNHNQTHPLFLYYASRTAHAPLQAPVEYLEKFSFIKNPVRQHYHAMVNVLDDVIGNITAALKTAGMWDNTILVIQSDNGGPIYQCQQLNSSVCGGANNYPLRGGKITPWQGGVRVNGFVSGGFVPTAQRGTRRSGMIHLADWMETFCQLANTTCTYDPAAAKLGLPQPDSLSMLPMILGRNLTSPRVEYPITATGNEMLIRWPWKVIKGTAGMPFWTGTKFPNNTSPNNGTGFSPLGGLNCKSGCLFNIKEDPTEHQDVAAGNPAILQSMMARLSYWENNTFQRNYGKPQRAACKYFVDQYDGFYGPFIDVQ